VASHAFVNPVVAVALGAWMLGEPVTLATLGGMALILVSVFFILRFGSE
jgi:drug/metabolite transporter (DMT)-like permease